MPISDELLQEYKALCTPPVDASAAWMRQRGYRFERLLNGLLGSDGLDPRTSYKAAGEQIDGSFFLDGRVFLMEAKWHSTQIPASSLYEFKGKVDGKLLGTLGAFISMSDYSEDAVDALTLGKTLNLILFDQSDLNAIVVDGWGFREVLRKKLRAAAEQGLVYFPMKSIQTTRSESRPVAIERLVVEPISGDIFVKQNSQPAAVDLLIICEGSIDSELLSTLAKRILEHEQKSAVVQTVVANGKQSIPRLANLLRAKINPAARMLLVADGDGDVPGTLSMLQQKTEFPEWTAIVPDPEIEVWLGLKVDELRRQGGMGRRMATLSAAKGIDLAKAREGHQSFEAFYRAVSEA